MGIAVPGLPSTASRQGILEPVSDSQRTDPRGYFDHNGSTPVHPMVARVMGASLLETFGNAAAPHAAGLVARAAIDDARAQVAAAIGARPEELCFTSGGTESNNQALFGVAAGRRRGHLVVSAIEHKSVLRAAERLEREGFEVTRVRPRATGAVHLRDVSNALREDTILVSVMLANNETGVVQPAREIASLCRKRGILFHTDAVCVLGKLPVDVRELGCDLLSLSAHKVYAPKGVGVLFIRQGVEIEPLVVGCGQQDGRRSGTENTAGVVAFGAALELLRRGGLEPETPYEHLRLALWRGLQERFPGTSINGEGAVLPNTLNVHFPGHSAADLQAALGLRGFSVAAGAAAGTGSASHVLLAMGHDEARARGSLRFSLGRSTDVTAIAALLEALEGVLASQGSSRPLEVRG